MVNTTQKGKKTPRYTIVARAGYFPALESLTGRDGQISMNLMEKLKEGAKVLASAYCQQLAMGGFNEVIKALREQARL